VLPPSFFGRKRQIDIVEVHIESGAAGFFDGRVGRWISLWLHPSIIGGLAGETKILGIPLSWRELPISGFPSMLCDLNALIR